MKLSRRFDELRRGVRSPRDRPEKQLPAILVIDDDASVREALALALTDHYQVVIRASAMDGVEALNDDLCAIVLDVKMMDRDGFWARTEIRKKNAHIPVIFYSAYHDVKDPYQGNQDYAPFAFIVKDGDYNKLLSVIDKAVESYKIDSEHRVLLEMLRKSQKKSR